MSSPPEVRHLAETLGTLLSAEPSENQKKLFDKYIGISQSQGCTDKVINYAIQRYNGRTLVHIAADKGLHEYLEILLNNGGDPNVMSFSPDLCQTPLHLAAFQGYAQCLQILIRHGAQIRAQNTHRITPVDLVRGKVKCESILQEAISKIEVPVRTKEKLQRIMELHRLLDAPSALDLERFISVYNSLSPTEMDLGSRWTDWFQQTLLYRAVDKQQKTVVEYLLAQSQSLPLSNLGNGDTPLKIASYHGNLEMVDLLLNHSPQLVFNSDEINKLSPLHVSCSRGERGLVQRMLCAVQVLYEKDITQKDLNMVDKLGRTPFYNACYHGELSVVRALLDFKHQFPSKLDINMAERTRRTPLHAAVSATKNSKEIVELLLQETELTVNCEAYPSSRSQKLLIKILDRKKSSPSLTMSPPSTPVGNNTSFTDDYPSSNETPLTTCSRVSDDVDANDFGIIKLNDKESTIQPLLQSMAIVTSPTPQLRVSRAVNGCLEVSNNTDNGCTPFNRILVTPLAEACIYRSRDIVELLINHGAIDKNGYGCQLAYLVQRLSLVHLILAKKCSLKVDYTDDRPSPTTYQLQWEEKHLQVIYGKWLTSPLYSFDDGPIDNLLCQPVKYTQLDSTMISSICLQRNELQTVPVQLFQLPNVQEINLSHNKLVCLPDESEGHWTCKSLLSFNLYHNSLQSLPYILWCLPSLEKFYCASNILTSIVTQYPLEHQNDLLGPELKEVNLSSNRLEKIDDLLFELPQITKLVLSSNQLRSLPDSLWDCETLQTLDVGDNLLTSLPRCQPSDLTVSSRATPSGAVLLEMATTLEDTQATFQNDLNNHSFYKEPSSHRRKKERSIRTNRKDKFMIQQLNEKLEEGREGGDAIIEMCDYSTLTHLTLANNQFTVFPPGLPCLAPNLTELDVSKNPLQSIDIIYLPQSLRKLQAKNCFLERIGNTLRSSQLKEIRKQCYHDDTLVICLHRSHSQLPYLQTLHLTGNKLKRFQLIKCILKRNTLDPTENETTFHVNCSALDLLYPSLEGLDLINNCLVGTFNPNIGRQTQLKWIRLSGNPDLEKLPLQLALLKNIRKLTEVKIDNLPNLIEPPKEYQDTSRIELGQLLTYMRSRLKDSVPYRTLKLFFIGCGKRGKTTLLRRLRERQAGDTERTEGIDIEEWSCKGAKKRLFRATQEPIQFLAWDFAGQEEYQVTHQCFYSRRALYLALFRLSDGEDGINELEPWLRNVQLRAPGCIVIVVGTHLDKVPDAEAQRLEELVGEKFRANKQDFPKVVSCISVSCVNRFKNNMDKLRQAIYDIATHLRLHPMDGVTLEHKADLAKDSPYGLLNQQIPKSFLSLQEKVSDFVKSCIEIEKPPYLNYEAFKRHFLQLFEDEEELHEAVHYLTLQGTLLHFEDYGLRDLYFLDPQWLAKLMARLISPSSAEKIQLENGKILISNLFTKDLFLHEEKPIADKYLQLLQKFEVALCIGDKEVIIPSLMPEQISYPKPNDSLKDIDLLEGHNNCYQPPLRRIWFTNYIPDGFWPRLICRLLNDQQIKSILNFYFFPTTDNTHLEWICWRNGLVFTSRGKTLLVIRRLDNSSTNWAGPDENCAPLESLSFKYRIEVHIYVPEMITTLQELNLFDSYCSFEEGEEMPTPFKVAGHATRLMVTISNHIVFLSSWFQGMIQVNKYGYIPCWKCYGGVTALPELGVVTSEVIGKASLMDLGGAPCVCLPFSSCVIPSCHEKDLKCPVHGNLKIVHSAPDLVFWDLVTSSDEMEHPRELHLLENDILGKGGYGFVCKGELRRFDDTTQSSPEIVAVKVFLSNMEGKMELMSPQELLQEARKDQQLSHAYREIRQEVIFLATLKHQNITRLIGVRTKPVYCLLLELAPMKSLKNMLKDYQTQKVIMEPLTLKQCARQIADGLNYLHSHQIVHLDMKSPNVLVWEFPVPFLPRSQRVLQAGNVWLKIADYGISQVSTSLMMKVATNQAGTPGYMAPELFENPGQEIFSTKVDVFAYGMTLYELVSYQPPFHKQDGPKRNHEVRDGKRPPIGSKEKHTPLLLQDLMRLCWDKDPSLRPSMKECLQWTSSLEFERLRTQLTLGSCSAISCACVSRVEPQYESEWATLIDSNSMPTLINGVLLNRKEIERHGSNIDLVLPKESLKIEESIVVDQKSHAQESIEKSTEDLEEDKEEKGHGLEPPVGSDDMPSKSLEHSSSASLLETKTLTTGLLAKEPKQKELKGEQAYSQIWMCGRDQKKGLLSVFIFPDHQKTPSRFFGYVGKEEIQALCPVRNAMWIGTSQGNLRIIHAPSLEVKFSGKLLPTEHESAAILKIIHVEEENCVLASLTSSEVWCLHDKLIGQPKSLAREQLISTTDEGGIGGPVYDLIKVKVDRRLQVWGTMDNNTLLRLEKSSESGKWESSYHRLSPYSHHMKTCSHIVWCSFQEEEEGKKEKTQCDHLWISYRSKGGIICFDLRTLQQRGHINCSERLKSKEDVDGSYQVTTLLAQGRRLYVGTVSGTVGVFDSQSFGLITNFTWHRGKVRTLLLLPEQVKGCVCAEVPKEENELKREETLRLRSLLSSKTPSTTNITNTCFIDNANANLSLVASIGNGRLKLIPETGGVDMESSVVKRKRQTRLSMSFINEDINLLIWHS